MWSVNAELHLLSYSYWKLAWILGNKWCQPDSVSALVLTVLRRRQSECQQQDGDGQTSHGVERTSWLPDEAEFDSLMEGAGIYW